MSDVEETGAYRLTRPLAAPGPLVFASPHSGDLYPEDMEAAPGLDLAALRSAEDVLVDRLVQPAPSVSIPFIAGRVGRSYLDLNRAEDELDPLLVEGARSRSPRAAAGYGVLARLSGDGRALYARRLAPGEVEARLERLHRPYHRALAGLMQAARSGAGRAALVDWHSMPEPDANPGPDVCLGDRHGAACDPRLTRRLKSLFEAEGLKTALNRPYAGGYATQTWGRPHAGLHAIQVELSRRLYLDETGLAPGPGWDRLADAIARVTAALAAEAPALIRAA